MPNEVVNNALPNMYSGAFIFFLGFLVTRCVDWATAYFKQPSLRVTFSEQDDVVAVTAHRRESSLTELPKHVPVSQMWVRVAVRNDNRQPATGCRAYLVGVDEMDAAGHFSSTQYNDSLPLNWAFEQQQAESVTLPKGVSRHFDLW